MGSAGSAARQGLIALFSGVYRVLALLGRLLMRSRWSPRCSSRYYLIKYALVPLICVVLRHRPRYW